MSQKTNRTRFKFSEDNALLLSQWPSFNQKYWLRNQFQEDYDSLEALLSDYITLFGRNAGNYFLSSSQIGNIGPSSIDAYRNLLIKDINTEKFNGGYTFPTIPLSLYKVGEQGAFSKNVIDYSSIENCYLSNLNWGGLPAQFVPISYSVLRNLNLSYSCFLGSSIRESKIINCDFFKSYISDRNFPVAQTTSTAQHFNSEFINCNFKESFLEELTIRRSNYIKCCFDEATMNQVDAGSAIKSDVLYKDCSFIDTDFSNNANTSSFGFEFCVMHRINLTTSGGVKNTINTFLGNDCTLATISGYDFRADMRNCVFVKTNFTNISIHSTANISGCDFTGSNLDNFYATKADLIATGCTYDERTLWVDGTPL